MKIFISVIFFTLFSFKIFCNQCIEIPENLKLKGDIRAKYKAESENRNARSFKSEMNLEGNYTLPEAWFSVKMKAVADNKKSPIISLEKAFLGYRLYENKNLSFDAEVGCTKLEMMFDSKMQFDSSTPFQGVHFVYKYFEKDVIDFKLHTGICANDIVKNHFTFILEGIWNRVGNTPVTIKYSFTDWNAPKIVEKYFYYYDPDYLYAISQLLISYDFLNAKFYAALLHNHQEKRNAEGFYVGIMIGKLKQLHHFALDINFQSSQKNLLSPCDNKSLSKGLQIKGNYCLTDNFDLEIRFSRLDNYRRNRIECQALYSW
jgi:hypothetical protein